MHTVQISYMLNQSDALAAMERKIVPQGIPPDCLAVSHVYSYEQIADADRQYLYLRANHPDCLVIGPKGETGPDNGFWVKSPVAPDKMGAYALGKGEGAA